MIPGGPSLALVSEATGTQRHARDRPNGIEPFLEQYTESYWYYGSGKVALRDGLRTVRSASSPVRPAETTLDPNVLLPAYIPDAVSEPIRELGLEPRYYAITDGLAPDMVDLESRVDRATIAIVSVNYFGFPQPNLAELSAFCDDLDCFHVDDNAHAAWSVADGQLLGTFGDLGITCLWKTLPIPNGALLYVTSPTLRDRFEPTDLAGVRDHLDASDVRFICKSFVDGVLDSSPYLRASIDSIVTNVTGSTPPNPGTRYEAVKRKLSKLSESICEVTDPDRIRGRRRENYRAWLDVVAGWTDVNPIYPALEPGICPQSLPIYTSHPDRVRRTLRDLGVDGVHSWPRLDPSVASAPEYRTATHLASHVLTLPVHQHVDPAQIASIGDRLVDSSATTTGRS